MAYIRQQKLSNLKNYRYSGVDHSLISYYILKPFYTNFVIKCFPMTMAPNLITLSGFGFIIINVLTLFYYNSTLDKDCPPWVYASWALGLFLYQTFDAVDGTQARRTHQSGPLGELFDHGVDALNTSLGVLIFAASLNLGMGWRTVIALLGEYHTKTLTLGIVNGPVEGVLLLISIYLFTAFKGHASFWQQPAFQALEIQPSAYLPQNIKDISFCDLYLIQGAVVLLVNVFQSARRIRGERSREALLGLLPITVTLLLVVLHLGLNPQILYNNLVPFILFTGIVNSYSVGQVIIAHLAQLSFPNFNILNLPLAYGILDSLGPLCQNHLGLGWPSLLSKSEYQTAYCFCMLGFAVGVYGSFVVDVIVTICDYLDIWCLTIKYPWNENEESKKIKKTA